MLFFCRHGESHANRLHMISNRGLEHGLTSTGRNQAAALAGRLVDRGITRIYTSPLLRAIETAVIVANRLGIDYETTDALREYDCGILEGRADEQAWSEWQRLHDDWVIHARHASRIEGGESFDDLRARFVPFVETLRRRYGESGDGLLCVSHGGLYAMMLPLVLPGFSGWIGHTGFVSAESGSGGLRYIDQVDGQPSSL